MTLCGFIHVYLLGLCWTFWMCKYIVFFKFESFLAIISSRIFSFFSFSPLFMGIPIILVLGFLSLSYSSLILLPCKLWHLWLFQFWESPYYPLALLFFVKCSIFWQLLFHLYISGLLVVSSERINVISVTSGLNFVFFLYLSKS